MMYIKNGEIYLRLTLKLTETYKSRSKKLTQNWNSWSNLKRVGSNSQSNSHDLFKFHLDQNHHVNFTL